MNDLYDDINKGMSESNVGGRKKRSAKDHLFILHGIINSINNDKTDDEVDVMVYDIEKAFDKLNLNQTLNDLVDILPDNKKDDRITTLHEANKITKVSINTPFGATEREIFERIVQQGGNWGGTFCSNSVDSLERKSSTLPTCSSPSKSNDTYLYKNVMKVPILSYIDDISKVSKCGLESMANNSFITSQIEMEKMHLNVRSLRKKTKCKSLHEGKKKTNCSLLFARGRELENVEEILYLGDLVNGKGDNINNIKSRVAKGKSIIFEIFNILDNICFGPHYF